MDNNSIDNTKEVTLAFSDRIKNLRYVFEEKVGLSYARNRGLYEARYDWISYIDDDAKAYADYVARVIWVVNTYSFDCFGGRFFPWYLEPKPKWLPKRFGEFPLLREEIGTLPSNLDVAGGVIVFRKAVLNVIGGFPVALGMSGKRVGYGEENWVQSELRRRSYTIGFDPELKIDHIVASYKFSVLWHFKRRYAKGKAAQILKGPDSTNRHAILVWALGVTVKECLRNSIKFIFKRGYYYQNYLLDSFGYLVQTIGFLKRS